MRELEKKNYIYIVNFVDIDHDSSLLAKISFIVRIFQLCDSNLMNYFNIYKLNFVRIFH